MSDVVITSGEQIKAMMKDVVAEHKKRGGIRNVYCLACGGSYASFWPMTYFLRSEAKTMHVDSISANEFVHATPKVVGENSLVFAMSLAGNTPETVAAAKRAKELGATVVVLCAQHEVPLEEYGDYTVWYRVELDRVWEETNQSLILNLAIELLEEAEGYEHYADAMDGMGKIGAICTKAREQVLARSEKWGAANRDEPVLYTMGSGPSTQVSYMQCICMFMEMEWVNSNSIHSGEFFHGPFEITDQDTSFLVFVSEGRTRVLDERALKFLRNYAKKVEVIDAKELGINTIQDSVVEFFNPIVHWCAGLEYAEGLAKAKKHPLMMRRYMYKVEY